MNVYYMNIGNDQVTTECAYLAHQEELMCILCAGICSTLTETNCS